MTLPKKALTERAIQSLRAPAQGRVILWDALVPGFGVRVTENNARTYILCARYPGSPNPCARSIAGVGKVSLEWARAKAREWQTAIAEGHDPKVERSETFAKIASEYMTREGKDLRTAKERQARLERDILPALGQRPISEIKKSEIIRLLDKVEDRGPEAAHKVLALLSVIMSWHESRSDSFRSPITKGMGRTQGVKRERILSDPELAQVWLACDGPFGRMVKFILLTGCRRTEASELRWSEIEGKLWTLPAARNKVGVELVRPLSDAALACVQPIGEWVFTNDGHRPIGGFTKYLAALHQVSGTEGWTLHDGRRSSRSLLARAGVSSEVAERCLGHVLPGVEGVYNRHRYLEEMKLAYDKLASLIDGIVEPKDNVIALVR